MKNQCWKHIQVQCQSCIEYPIVDVVEKYVKGDKKWNMRIFSIDARFVLCVCCQNL